MQLFFFFFKKYLNLFKWATARFFKRRWNNMVNIVKLSKFDSACNLKKGTYLDVLYNFGFV